MKKFTDAQIILEALIIAERYWNKQAMYNGGCQPSNKSVVDTKEAGRKATHALSIIHEFISIIHEFSETERGGS